MPNQHTMSRATPRKSRHRRDASGGGGPSGHHLPKTVATSDYESDAVHYLETRTPAVTEAALLPRLNRTNTEINLSVLQRWLPNIRSIASIAANAVVYAFSPTTHEWDKAGIEGAMFVCDQDPNELGMPRSCVYLLNRRSLDNLHIDLAAVSHFEVQNELLIFNLGDKVLGLWIHADQEDTRDTNAATIQERWARVRAAAVPVGQAEAQKTGGTSAAGETMGPAMQAIGRRLSISDLFGRARDTADG